MKGRRGDPVLAFFTPRSEFSSDTIRAEIEIEPGSPSEVQSGGVLADGATGFEPVTACL